MTENELLALFLEKVPAEYPKHMFCEFAAAAARGVIRPFLQGLLKAIAAVEKDCPGYAEEILGRIGGVRETGVQKFEALIHHRSQFVNLDDRVKGWRERWADEDGRFKENFRHIELPW